MKTNEITKFLKKHKTPLLIAAGVLVVIVVVWIIWKRTKGVYTRDKELAEQNTGQQVTISINWNDLLTRLLNAFSGPNSSSTNEAEVYAVLGTLRNQADWEYLKRSWNTYCENMPWWNRLKYTILNTSNYKSLTASLIYELDSGELQQCRDILIAKGITPDF